MFGTCHVLFRPTSGKEKYDIERAGRNLRSGWERSSGCQTAQAKSGLGVRRCFSDCKSGRLQQRSAVGWVLRKGCIWRGAERSRGQQELGCGVTSQPLKRQHRYSRARAPCSHRCSFSGEPFQKVTSKCLQGQETEIRGGTHVRRCETSIRVPGAPVSLPPLHPLPLRDQ